MRGRRGDTGVIGALTRMVAVGSDDVAAADALGALAVHDAELVAAAIERALGSSDSRARRRLTQALADVPGGSASALLETLSNDIDRHVAVTATYLLRARDEG